MRISDWSSDVCSSDLLSPGARALPRRDHRADAPRPVPVRDGTADPLLHSRSEEHTSELQSLMRISYAVFCLKKKNTIQTVIRTSIPKSYNTQNNLKITNMMKRQ